MSLKKTLLLAIILTAAIFYILKVELPRDQEAQKKDLLFKDLTSDEIKQIEITRNGESYVLKNSRPAPSTVSDKSADRSEIPETGEVSFQNWQVGEKTGASLDAGAMTTLVTGIKNLKLDDSISTEDAEGDLSVYGLSQPQLTVKVATVDRSEELQFGKMNALVDKRYLKLMSSGALYMVPESAFSSVNKGVDDFRDKTPIDFLDKDLARLTIKSPSREIVLSQDGAGKWQINEPLNAQASKEIVLGITRTLRNIRAQQFIDDTSEAKKYNLEKPQANITLDFDEKADRAPIEIALSERVNKNEDAVEILAYASVSGTPSLYGLSMNPIPSIVKTVEELRERKLFSVEPQSIEKTTIQRSGGETTVISRGEAGWLVNGKAGDAAFVAQFLTDLSGFEAASFPSVEKEKALADPEVTITVEYRSGADGAPLSNKAISIGKEGAKKDGTERIVLISDLPYPLAITPETYRKIVPSEEGLIKLAEPEAAPTLVPTDQE